MENFPAIQIEQVERIFAKKDAFYVRMLKQFLDGHANDLLKVEEALEENDIETVRRVIHGLKGTSGTLGAMNLHFCTENSLRCLDAGGTPHLDDLEKHFNLFITDAKTIVQNGFFRKENDGVQ